MTAERAKLIERLRANMAKQAEIVSELAMWNKVEEQGIDPETVKAFTFREEFLTQRDKRAYRNAIVNGKVDRFVNFYNALRMKDGSLKKLDPMIAKP